MNHDDVQPYIPSIDMETTDVHASLIPTTRANLSQSYLDNHPNSFGSLDEGSMFPTQSNFDNNIWTDSNPGGNDLDEIDEDDDDEVPDKIGIQMNAAIEFAGSTHNYSQILWEEDEEALREIGEHLGEDADFLFTGKMGRNSKKRRGKGRRFAKGQSQAKTRIPEALQSTFGKANLAYTMGQHDEAIKQLHEIIRQAPNAQPAWSTLAMVHEELGNKSKAVQAYLMAAHLLFKDAELWKRLARMSEDIGDMNQALYCLNKAVRADPDDLECKWSRALIHRDLGRLEQAAYGLQDILEIIPDSVDAVKELARIYVLLEDIPQAIRYFESLMSMDEADCFPTAGTQDEDGVGNDLALLVKDTALDAASDLPDQYRMGYEELNMLSELYIEVGEYEKAIFTIKQGVHRLCKLPLTVIDCDTDNEFDPCLENTIHLPIELRTKLGICRLYLGDSTLAQYHFDILYEEGTETYSELYFDVAEAYMGCRKFAPAFEILKVLTQNESTNVSVTWSRMARCQHQLGNNTMAIKLYRNASKADPDNADLKRSLAEIYEALGDETQALNYFKEADIAENLLKQAKLDASKIQGISSSLLTVQAEEKRRQTRLAADKALIHAQEQVRYFENVVNFEKFKQLSKLPVLDSLQKIDLLRCSRKLMSRFQSSRIFYSESRLKSWAAEQMPSVNKIPDDFDQPLELEFNLNINSAQSTEITSINFESVAEGLTLNDWLSVFIKYAVIMASDNKEDDAHAALSIALDSIVFFQSKPKRAFIRTVMLYVAMYSRNYARISELCRHLSQNMPFSDDAYRLYCAMFSAGAAASTMLASGANLKYFFRQIRLKSHQNNTSDTLATKFPLLHILYGHILCLARVYNGAIVHYMHAYSIAPNDPMTNFALGNAHIHRAMQRKSESRHTHISQGFSFLFKYAELRGENLETDYNLGRAFHTVGLSHLAVHYYRKIIQAKKSRFTCFAAYNLHLIYLSVGSNGLAHKVLQQNCTL
ncbi:transcription factor TFIIIC subunit tfc4 [Batrachochytrium dendrobatidis]|nr:transcription factor TFIIIC subunit tfc4 [Batrachochytrium dendrobatidis]